MARISNGLGILLALVFVFLLFESFAHNRFEVVEPRLHNGDDWARGLVFGRLLRSREAGVLSDSAVLGWYSDAPWRYVDGVAHTGGQRRVPSERRQLQFFEKRRQGSDQVYFNQYRSHLGLVALLAGVADRLLGPADPLERYATFEIVNVLLVVTCLAFFVGWVHLEFGLGAAILVASGLVVSRGHVAYARSLFWNYWTLLWPITAVLLCLLWEQRTGRSLRGTVLGVVFAGIAVRLASSYEYATCLFTGLLFAFLYPAVRYGWEGPALFSRLRDVALVALAAIALVLSLHLVQIASLEGDSVVKATQNLFDTVHRRTIGREGEGVSMLRNVEAGIHSWPVLLRFRGVHLLAALGAVGVLGSLLAALHRDFRRTFLAVLVLNVGGVLAVLSWIVFAAQHSRRHPHYVFALWNLFFLPFLLILVTVVADRALSSLAPLASRASKLSASLRGGHPR